MKTNCRALTRAIETMNSEILSLHLNLNRERKFRKKLIEQICGAAHKLFKMVRQHSPSCRINSSRGHAKCTCGADDFNRELSDVFMDLLDLEVE